jgi:hypothetical protein
VGKQLEADKGWLRNVAKSSSSTTVIVWVGVLHTALQQALPLYFELVMRAGRLV